MSEPARPYRSTAVFDETTLPKSLRRQHATKKGVWGVIRVIEGRLRLTFVDTDIDETLDPDHPGLLRPEELHFVTPIGPVKMQIDFYDRPPEGADHRIDR